MFGSTNKKNYNCQQQAISHLQSMFPSLNLNDLSKNSSLWEVVQRSAQKLPRPCLGDVTSTISNMKNVVDNQQLKIQKNMIQIQEYEQTILKKQTSAPVYSQNYHMNEHIYDHPHTDSKRSLLYNGNYQKYTNSYDDNELGNYQFVEQKQQFFCDPLDYFGHNNIKSNQQRYDQKQVDKYLNFDF